jgi:hypothetical protein
MSVRSPSLPKMVGYIYGGMQFPSYRPIGKTYADAAFSSRALCFYTLLFFSNDGSLASFSRIKHV